jgi:hypothetical protein
MRKVAAFVGAATIVALFVPAAPTHADDANQECTDGEGVTIVVDFQELGGGVNVRCAPQPIHNGFDVFRNAQVSYEQYRGFICRIAGLPENGPCDHYPPADAYWVYWTAEPGGQWTYSSLGAGSRTPPPGSLDGWSFAKNRDSSNRPPPRYPVPPAHAAATTTSTSAAHAVAPPAPSSPATVIATGPTSTAVDTTTSTTVLMELLPPRPTTIPFGNVDLSVHDAKGTSLGFLLGVVAVATLAAMGIVFARHGRL